MKVTISPSDLMIINRALAHDAVPKQKSFFIDDEGKYVAYMKRQSAVMSAKDTKKDIEVSATKMLRQLDESESRSIRRKYEGESKTVDRHLKIIIDVVSKYSSFEQLKSYAPNLLKLL